MSALKYQLRALLPSLSAEANRIQDPEVKRRLYLIKAVADSSKDVKKVCEARGVSTDLFYKWAKRLLRIGNLTALESGSKAPIRKWNKTPKRVEKRILALRKESPFEGPERLSRALKKKFNMRCAPSTVGAVLKRKGLITQAYKERLTKKHMKRYRRVLPGFMQMDIKYVPYLVDQKQLYQFSAIDHHSSWRFIRCYPSRSLTKTLSFLDLLFAAAPFAIMQIQTDNATEFTDKFSSSGGVKATGFHAFDQWCKQKQIDHRLIPVGQKEINGKVENSHKWDDREFYSQSSFSTHQELNERLFAYNSNWNENRETKTLGWKTPNEVIEDSYVRAIAYLKYMLKRNPKPIKTKRLDIPAGYIIEPIVPKDKTAKKIKKKTDLDRYLQYLEWDEKKTSLKCFLPMPTIFQVYSKGA